MELIHLGYILIGLGAAALIVGLVIKRLRSR